jgi:hypothetical protein
MGARIAVNIPEDELGMIETSTHSVAWCVIEMCSPWLNGAQHERDFKVIPSAALKTADREVPKSCEAYGHWRLYRTLEGVEGAPGSGKLWQIEHGNWNASIFNEAREFLRQYGASTSTDDAEVKL